MASLMDDLIAVMDKEAVCYEDYLKLANKKKEVIIKGNVLGLQEITQEEEIVAGQLFRLEKKRQDTVQDICLVTNRKPENFTVSTLIEDLAKQADQAQNLRQVAERLLTAVEACKQINQTNQALIHQSLEFLEFNLNALAGLSQAEPGQTYAKKGESRADHRGRSQFDAKQ